MARVLVTGGAGFIGSHLVETLVGLGFDVRVLDNLSSGKLANLSAVMNHIEMIAADVRDQAAMAAAVRGVEFVFHEAALVSVPASLEHPDEACDTIVRGTLNILEAARCAGVVRVIMAGSSAVYGNGPENPRRENAVLAPLSPYAAAKAAAEAFGLAYYHSYGLENLTLRYFNVFGPRQDPSSTYAAVIPRFIDTMVNGNRPVVFGDGHQTRDFVHVHDVVRANLLAMAAPVAHGEAINIAGGAPVDLNGLLSLIAMILGCNPEIDYAPFRPGDVRDSCADLARALEMLGFRPQIGLSEGLKTLIDWWIGAGKREQEQAS